MQPISLKQCCRQYLYNTIGVKQSIYINSCYYNGRLLRFAWLRMWLFRWHTRNKIWFLPYPISRVILFGWSPAVISEEYHKYLISNITPFVRYRWCWKKTLKVEYHWQLTRILKWDRRAALPQIAADSSGGVSTSISLRTVCSMGRHWYGLLKAQCVPLLTAQHKTLRPRGPANTAIGLLKTGNMLPCFMSIVSNAVGRRNIYG